MDINEVFRGGGRSVEFLDQINKASIVMLDETGIVPHALAGRIANGIAQVIAQERESPPQRSADYLDYEPRLHCRGGPGCLAAAHRAQPPGHRVGHRAHESARRAAQGNAKRW